MKIGQVMARASDEEGRLGAALVYAAAGYAVFPCAPGAKRPLTPRGFRGATTDPAQLRAWWARWPDGNIGLATGGGGVDVVDIDRRPTGSGFAAMTGAEEAGMTAGWVCRVATPSGGEHRYYPAEPDRPQPSWSLTSVHVDFRGVGGYVLVPPSVITGAGTYRPIAVGEEGRPLDAAALRRHLTPDRPPPRRVSAQGRIAGVSSRLAGWVATRPEGTRNASLFWAACRYAEADVSHLDAHDELGTAAAQAGLGPAEAAATIRSAYRTAHPLPPPRTQRQGRPDRSLSR
ncbi:bifunctional DNA primase/polymerase [Euzebya sp.]|uniref:bifunctional DNA primase/polymerase n=1 Tax=Euzebya sp. TaxID=1971409 RepID=UPI00351630B3